MANETALAAYRRLSAKIGETDARHVLRSVTGLSWGELMLAGARALTDGEREAAANAERRILSGEPLQYVLGRWEFMGLPFITDARALIPRQDTECLVEAALEMKLKTALDLCCGTGCIGVSLAKLGGARVTFSDISRDCLDISRENCALNGVSGNFVEGDLFENITGGFDVIVTNPPYLTRADMDVLQREVRREPAPALYGGDDGLDVIRRITAEAPRFLNAGGAVIMEIGASQGASVAALSGGRIIKDINGLDRAVIFGGSHA